jgi:hypothetical protein
LIIKASTAALRTENAEALQLGQRQTQRTTETADGKHEAETRLEDLIIEEAGLLQSYSEDHRDVVNLAKVTVMPSAVRVLANQELLSLGKTIADLAEPLTVGDPTPGADFDITVESVAGLREAAESFGDQIGQPAGTRAARKEVTRELREKAQGMLKLLDNMDRLLPRFRKQPGGPEFTGAWNNARRIVNLGHRFEKAPEATGTAPQ